MSQGISMSMSGPGQVFQACVGVLALASSLLLASSPASAVSRTIRFSHPDPGSVDGFKIHLGETPGSFRAAVDVGMPSSAGGVYSAVVDATSTDRVVAVSAYNAAGGSPLSNEGSFTVAPAPSEPEGGSEAGGGDGSGAAPDVSGATSWVVSAVGSGPDGVLQVFRPDGSIAGLASAQVPPRGGLEALSALRPVRCEVDGDGEPDLVLGYGPGGGGMVEVRHGEAGGFAHRAWISINWPGYNEADGSTWPACGDTDGDGRDEIVIGLGGAGQGWFQIFDDAAGGFRPVATPFEEPGWVRVSWETYPGGTTYPALGDFDGDGRDEIVVGLGSGGGGWFQVFDDAGREYAPMETPFGNGWLQSTWSGYNAQNGELVPAAGDLDGDGRDEIVTGLGMGGAGWLQAFDDARGAFEPVGTEAGNGWFNVHWPDYTAAEGWTVPVLVDLNASGADEVLVGMGPTAAGRIGVFSDARSGLGTGPLFGGFVAAPEGSGARPVLAR